jgi:hypothetical protein
LADSTAGEKKRPAVPVFPFGSPLDSTVEKKQITPLFFHALVVDGRLLSSALLLVM